MATNELPALLARTASEKDLDRIAQSVGSNWEMLAPYLLKVNAMATVEQIKEDHRKTVTRVYYLLLTWSKQAAPDTTLGHLFHQMLQVGTSVTVEWRTIAKYLDIDERDIRACKKGYQPPVQKHSTNPSIPATDEQNSQQQLQLPVQIRTLEPMEVDGILSTKREKMEGVEEYGSRKMFKVVDANQTVGPSLEERKQKKTYRPPKSACIFDGRLIKLEDVDIKNLENSLGKEPIGTGAFGKVYSNDSDENGFGMPVAVKKVSTSTNGSYSNIRREMISSRIMHPFILPLLAVVDRPDRNTEQWFVSPLCKRGDLHAAIKNDRAVQGKLMMKAATRVKILLHVALAIQYIHTEVTEVRGVILHKDISSYNVVLDDSFNARLIDFGLAREKDDITTDFKGRRCYEHPDVGNGIGARESWDYYSFGVMIREMLTGLEPQGCKGKFLKRMDPTEVLGKIDKNVWLTGQKAEKLNEIARECLEQNEWTVEEFNEKVVEKIYGIWKDFGQSKILEGPENHDKCHICMINPKARETSMSKVHKTNCRQKIEVCIACEKNSFLNPVTCYCGERLTPTIGSKYGALLVAGNDTDNKSLAKALAKDIEELKKLITSKAPRIMGISENKVRTVVPRFLNIPKSGAESEKLWPEVKEHFKFFSEDTEVETLLIYFSCHGVSNMSMGDAEKQNCFRLGSDSITLAEFKKELESLGNIDKLIIILDRCYPPMVRFNQTTRKFIQINACEENKKADITETGSVFTKYLIQGLKANSERTRCKGNNCQICDAYWSNRSDFISVSSLFDYVKKHMEEIKGPIPDRQMQRDFPNIAFYTDEEVNIEFTFGEEKTGVPLEYLQNMEQLENKLSEVFKGDKSTTRVRIQRDTYRKDDRFVTCETLEKVMSAWVHRQPLTVTFEKNEKY